MSILSRLRSGKFAVVVFCGPQNSGKSFLANQFIRETLLNNSNFSSENLFKVRDALGKGTKGIMMWNKLVPVGAGV